MNQKQKRSYAAPMSETVEVRMNGVLCESTISILLLDQPNEHSSFGDNWEWN